MESKKIVMMLLIFTIVFTIIGGTLAYLNWESDNNRKTNITFTVNPDFTCGADGGGNITSNDVNLIPTDCTNSEYAIKRVITTNVTTTGNKVVSMDLWLDINSISTNLSNSDNFKYALSKNGNSCESGIFSQGTFKNKHSGDKIQLLTGTEYATLSDKYYLYIWLDKAETNSNTMNQPFDFSLGGVCQDHGLEKATLKSLDSTSYFRESAYKTKITDVYFIYDDDLPEGIQTNYVKTYALGASSARPITGYLIENTDEGAAEDTYKVYVSSKYKIYAGILTNAFNGMTALKSISFDNFDTSNTTTMMNMFHECNSLLSLDLSGFNTLKVTSMNSGDGATGGMFKNCNSLTTLDLSYFDTSRIVNMNNMFSGCSNLQSLDVTSFNTSNVTNMSSMFFSCSKLTTLDLSSFNISNVNGTTTNRGLYQLFRNCSRLTTIYVSDIWQPVSNVTSTSMFGGCTSLVGGAGTVYNSSYQNKTYARIDNPPDAPGYLTYKPYNGS